MDKKKTLILNTLAAAAVWAGATVSQAQNVGSVQMCGSVCSNDSIILYLNVLQPDGSKLEGVTADELSNYLDILEDGQLISPSRSDLLDVGSGQQIPGEYTFSVLVDLNIPSESKQGIYRAVSELVESAQEGCVYLSFFSDRVTSSHLVSRDNLSSYASMFDAPSASDKNFYSALYAKLSEFEANAGILEAQAMREAGYSRNPQVAEKASLNPDKNLLFVFTESSQEPAFELQSGINWQEVSDYLSDEGNGNMPSVFAFYYDEGVSGLNSDFETELRSICESTRSDRRGRYMPATDIQSVMRGFQQVINDKKYDYAYAYQATEGRSYHGTVRYVAQWKGDVVGSAEYTIGSQEHPWPVVVASGSDSAIKYLVAVIAALIIFLFFYAIMKVGVPLSRSKAFEMKYYKKYVPDANVTRRVCHYCRQDIQPGRLVVVRCKHIMHASCWKQNGYKCAEYGQNCKEGIQPHVDWRDLFSMRSLQESTQTISGILAGLLCWVIYELIGHGILQSLAGVIIDTCMTNEEQRQMLYSVCEGKISAFFLIGILLGFFLSLVFRWNDEYRGKDWKVVLKVIGLSLLSCVIGFAAFALGAVLLCGILSASGLSYIPWYCSLPAYLLFSLCVSVSLIIKSTIPLKSALIGGCCSALIGFLVLYFADVTGGQWSWMPMLLNFVIYGGGLGASLVTVRMIAERYFLVIQNGSRAGQRIPIHKWMNATGGGNRVKLGLSTECEIQMNWEKSIKVQPEHAQLYVDPERRLPMIKPSGPVLYNSRTDLPVGKESVLSNGDTFKIGDTIFLYTENE